MKICAIVFFAVLVTQSSASLFDTIRGAFQPLGNCVGKLYNDVVSDLKQTMDCTVMAVEHAFSWTTMFGRNAEYYEEMCTGIKKNASKAFNDAYNVASKDISAKEHYVNQLENTIEKSPADAKERKTIEEAFLNETLRLQQIHKIICEELNKLTDNVGKRIKILDHDVPDAETVLGEVKHLYEIEQFDRTSSRANEVRNTFDKVLSLLQVNDTGGGVYSDDEEVKVIMKGIGKSLGKAVDDVEKKFMEWKQENKKPQETISKNITLEHNDNEVSSKQDKDGSKLKRQSATFDVTPLDTYSRVESQNKSDLTHSMDSQLIPILNISRPQFKKIDLKNESSLIATTKKSIQTSSKVTHHNSTDNRELSSQTSLLTNQSEVNQDAIHLRRLLPNHFENVENRESSLHLAEKIWNPGNQVSNSTKYNSNVPEYTQLTLKGIQFQKAADILKSSERFSESQKTVRQSTTEKSQDISRDSDIRQGRDRLGDLPKDPIIDDGQSIQANDTSFRPGISKQTNIMITNKVLEQKKQNQTTNFTKDSHSTEANNEKAESARMESNMRSNNSEENESPKTSQMIRKTDNKSSEDNIKPVKGLNESQSSISKSSLNNLQLNMSAAIADHSELKHENTQTVNQGSAIHSSQLEGANKTVLVKSNSHPSNAKHNLDSKQVNIQLTENNPKAIVKNYQRLSVENNQYKNQTNNGTTSENYSKTTQDDSHLDNSTCLNQNPEIVQETGQSLNATEKLNLVQKRNETVNADQLSSIKNKPDQTELKQKSGQYKSDDKTPESTQGNMQLSIQKKPDIILENNQTVANHSSLVVNLEVKLEFNQNLVATDNSDFLQKESLRSSAPKSPTIIQKSSEPLSNASNTWLNKNNSHTHGTGNYSEATQEYNQPLNLSPTTDLIKENDQSLSAQKSELFTEILGKSEENPGLIIGNSKPLSRENGRDMITESSQPPIAENGDEKKQQSNESLIALNNQKIKEIYISESAEKLKQDSNQHTNVEEKSDLTQKTSQPLSVQNHLQTNEEHNGLSASENSNVTQKSKKFINAKNQKFSQPVTLAVNQEDSQPVSIEKEKLNDTIFPDRSLPLNAENNKEMIPESSDVKKSELIMVQEEGKNNQHKNIKNSESLNKNLTTELIESGTLPNSSMEETQLNIYNSSEYMKSNQQSSQEIQNIPKLTEDIVSDDQYKSQNNHDDTKLASAAIHLWSEIGKKENKTVESPHEVSQESNHSDIPQMIKESTNSFNKLVSQITHSGGNYESLDENLHSPQNNAADISQQLRESSNLQTLTESTQLTKENYGSEVVQIQVPPEKRIEYSTLSSIVNSSEEEHVPSPTFSTDPVHSFEGQMIEDDSYVPSPRFSHVLNKQTPLDEPGLVRDSTYSNQNQYVPNPKFNYPFDQSTYPTESLPDLASGWQEGSDDTFSEIQSEEKQQQPLGSSFTQDYFSTEKSESYDFFTEPMSDIESIVQDSRRSESLMKSLFSNMDHEHNVFEEPDMLYN